ncbi:hypothetical protein [Arthrobacter koreensis]
MANIVAAHQPRYLMPGNGNDSMQCECGKWRGDVVELHTAHVAEELTKAGYGNVPDALREAAGEMPIETLGGADKASTWLRNRAGLLDTAAANLAAALNDEEGRALVQAIHDRKAASNGN